jgi:hypothetical protein
MPGMGARSRASSVDKRPAAAASPSAWIAGLDQKVMYDLGPLLRGEQVRGNVHALDRTLDEPPLLTR